MMNWSNLLSLNKFNTKDRKRISQDEKRVAFEVDYDRIIFSSEFRSLQDKTQVIPLSQTDFVHTRLTHSMEVSVVGRSLGRSVGQSILERHKYLKDLGYKINDFGSIVAAAALAHDIGNPPFGHGGEKAIGSYFSQGNGKSLKTRLTKNQYQDLCDFEGNANGFKILTEKNLKDNGSFRLTYATLGAFIKYPKESLPKKVTNNICDKKFGFFQSEKDLFLKTMEGVNLISRSTDYISFVRHPLAFLVEAADDICYSIIDFEDGINLGLITENEAEENFRNLLKNKINNQKYKMLKYKEDRISYLRSIAISILINDIISIFLDYEEDILQGKFYTSLIDKSSYSNQINQILHLSRQRIYNSSEVIEKEIAGYHMLKTLLDTFVSTYINFKEEKLTSYDNLILQIIPEKYLDSDTLYDGIIQICNFVSGLSDGKVVTLHKKIAGISW